MTISGELAAWAAVVIAAQGGFQVLTQWRLRKIEDMLGNGKPGVFARIEEVKVIADDYVRRTELNGLCSLRHTEIMAAVERERERER